MRSPGWGRDGPNRAGWGRSRGWRPAGAVGPGGDGAGVARTHPAPSRVNQRAPRLTGRPERPDPPLAGVSTTLVLLRGEGAPGASGEQERGALPGPLDRSRAPKPPRTRRDGRHWRPWHRSEPTSCITHPQKNLRSVLVASIPVARKQLPYLFCTFLPAKGSTKTKTKQNNKTTTKLRIITKDLPGENLHVGRSSHTPDKLLETKVSQRQKF